MRRVTGCDWWTKRNTWGYRIILHPSSVILVVLGNIVLVSVRSFKWHVGCASINLGVLPSIGGKTLNSVEIYSLKTSLKSFFND